DLGDLQSSTTRDRADITLELGRELLRHRDILSVRAKPTQEVSTDPAADPGPQVAVSAVTTRPRKRCCGGRGRTARAMFGSLAIADLWRSDRVSQGSVRTHAQRACRCRHSNTPPT